MFCQVDGHYETCSSKFIVFSYNIDRFLWGIGSYPNGTDIMEFVEYDHYTRSACVDIQLNHSSTYYNVIKAYNKAINSRQSNVSSDGSK